MNQLPALLWILALTTGAAESPVTVPLSIDGFLKMPPAQVPQVLRRADNFDLVRKWVDAAIATERMDLVEALMRDGNGCYYTMGPMLASPPSDFKADFMVLYFRLGSPTWLDDPEVMALAEGIKGSYSPEGALPIIKGVNEILPEREVTHDEIQHRAARLKIADEMEAALLQRKTARTLGGASPYQSVPAATATTAAAVGRAESVPADADHSTAWWLLGLAILAIFFGIGALRKAGRSQRGDG